MNLEDVLDLIDEESAIEFLKGVIRINTTNPPGNELELAKFIKEYLDKYSITNNIDDLGDNRANIIGEIKGCGERKDLLFNGHLDVVPPGDVAWKYDPFSGIIEDGKLYGRGTSDMKSGLSAMIVASSIVKKANLSLKGDLLVTGTAGEEFDSIGAKKLLEKDTLNNVGAAVIGEPSDLKIFSATKGTLWIEFTTIGKTAHGSMPEYGNNAIIQMNYLIKKLREYKFKFNLHPLLGNPTINLGTIKGGVKTNVVPDKCTLTVDIRTVPGQTNDAIISDMKDIVVALEREIEDFKCTLKVINDRCSVETDINSPFIAQSKIALNKSLGKEFTPLGVKYYTDASIFMPKLNIPTIIMGPGNEKLAHQPNEYVEIDKYIEAIKFYIAIIIEYLC